MQKGQKRSAKQAKRAARKPGHGRARRNGFVLGPRAVDYLTHLRLLGYA